MVEQVGEQVEADEHAADDDGGAKHGVHVGVLQRIGEIEDSARLLRSPLTNTLECLLSPDLVFALDFVADECCIENHLFPRLAGNSVEISTVTGKLFVDYESARGYLTGRIVVLGMYNLGL